MILLRKKNTCISLYSPSRPYFIRTSNGKNMIKKGENRIMVRMLLGDTKILRVPYTLGLMSTRLSFKFIRVLSNPPTKI